jgi:hypothetical protein
MAPATIAGASSRRTAKSRRGGWDRDSVISAIQEWVDTYGEPPRAADWNPSSAKWSGQQWRVERYRAGRADGSAWPALNSAKRPFGGSLNAAIRAAGFEPAKPGPTRRADVDPEQAGRAVISPEGRAMVQAALAQAREAEKRVAALEARLARIREQQEKNDNKIKTTTKVVRERVVDDAAIARAQRTAAAAEAKADAVIADARERAASAKAEASQSRRAIRRLSARLERGEATIAALRDDRREQKAANADLADRLSDAERALARSRAETLAAEGEARAAQAAMAKATRTAGGGSATGEAEALVALAQAEAAAARRAAREAEARAAAFARDLAAVRGEARALTPGELAELRSCGPSGPAVLAASLKGLARARDRSRSGHDTSRTALAAALIDVAAAAINWRERL